MQKSIVISQSMYFPWVGLLEQIRLADIFVHYDDVQFSKGSFTNRVQVKTEHGERWMTVPMRDFTLGQKINEVKIDETKDWRSQHRDVLRQAYLKSPFRDEMLALVDRVFVQPATYIADVARTSLMEVANYFGLVENKQFISSESFGIGGAGNQRVHDIVTTLKGTTYITGHGAFNYIDHQFFEQSGISVQYMDYRRISYPQIHGEFTPFVTALDLVANCGKNGVNVIQSETIHWKDFIRVKAQ